MDCDKHSHSNRQARISVTIDLLYERFFKFGYFYKIYLIGESFREWIWKSIYFGQV